MIQLLLALAAIVAVAKVMGWLATRLAQPAVVGEILAGVLIGPTLFGGVVSDLVFPADIRPMLSSLANVGLVLFMFLVGLEFNRDLLRERFGTIAALSLGSMVTPFLLGVLLATVLRPDDDRPAFALYLGTAMAVTAFPVLARMLADWGMGRDGVGVLALGSAALGDLLAWSMLAVTIALLGSGAGGQWRLPLVLLLVLVSFLVVRPLLARIAASGRDAFAVVLIGLLGWSALTEWMGLHFIFGAFLFGLVMPSATTLRADVTLRVEQVGKVLLLPVYFVVAGFNVDLSRTTWSGFADFGLILLVAVGGKFAGAVGAARWCGLDWRESATVGALLNTRGLTELVILGIGLQLGLLDRDLYSQLVLMAVLTTMMTGPLVKLLRRGAAPVEVVSSPRRR
ncbi:cation:proton antiporter [Saccharothrix sp. Mg75]|uniref:cation:proton antiporter n=1 Tax=Saccharothrix sp. Mg75 TaxID=3445357 RepID=UPI003EE8300A